MPNPTLSPTSLPRRNVSPLGLAGLFAFTLAITLLTVPATADNWPRFRGELGTGHAVKTDVPTQWNAKDVQYRVAIKGRGQSSPIIWGDRIFVTSASSDGQERHVFCLNKADGKTIWQQTVKTDGPQKVHRMNSWATASCATDGKQVVAFFGEAGLHGFDIDGKKLWSKALGSFPGPWGNAASPILLGDQVIQNCDAEGSSFLIALNKATGKTIWKTTRANKPRGGWSTPMLIDTGDRKELILNGEFGVKGYDPTNGKELWFCKGFNGRGTPVPAWGGGLLYVVNGKPGDVYAVKPGGSGDVTKTRMAWHSSRRGGRDLPSPIAVGPYLFVCSMGGIGSCYDAATGKTLWTERLGGSYSASPIAANGLIYIQNEAGEVIVIKPDKKLNIVSRNKLNNQDGEIFRASLGVSNGQLFARSDQAIYCISQPSK